MATSTADSTVPGYNRPFVPLGFDLLVSAVWLPFGGADRLRNRALDLLEIGPGMRVLEPGCGTGGITRLLLKRGAAVTAVDGSQNMLARARSKAPGAAFVCSMLQSLQLDASFDRVLFAFVLHELNPAQRASALATGARALAPGGTLAILDHAVPTSGALARAWRAFLLRLEPPTVRDCIERGYTDEVSAAGLQCVSRHALAGGTAALLLARRQA